MDIQEYKCPNCGREIKFDTSSQNLKCPFCDTEFEIEALIEFQKEMSMPETDQIDLKTGKAAAWDESDLGDLSTGCCPSCGAELIGDNNTIATVCPCCGNTQIISQRVKGLLKPEYVIPFQLEKQTAVDALKKFYHKKRLLPNHFKEENQINNIQGLYVPFWLFDLRARGHITYKATKVRFWSDSSYNYTQTSFFSVIRDGNMDFEKIPVDGSEKMDDNYMDAIEPFDYTKLKNFHSAYLSGYLAEKYDVDANACKDRAVKRIKNSMESEFKRSVTGYTTVIKEHSTVSVTDGNASYSLIPVWVINTKYKNKIYQFIMNGQSGLIVGKLPVDKGKFMKYLLIFMGSFGLAFTLIIQLLRLFS